MDTLIDGQEEFGDVVAISFKESEGYQLPKNQIQYLNLLYNVASKHNIDNIKNKISRNLIFNIPSNIEPLDFATAFQDYGADTAEFPKLRESATEWIENRARANAPIPAGTHRIWVEEDPPSEQLMELTGEVYRSLFAKIPYRIVRRDIIVKAYSLLQVFRPEDQRVEHPDEVQQIYYIAPVDRRIYCMPMRLDWTGHDASNPARTVYVQSQVPSVEISPILCPSRGIFSVREGDKTSEALVYFDPPLEPEQTDHYPIKVCDYALLKGVMEDLYSENGSFLGISNHAAWEIEEARLILAVPEGFSHITVGWRCAEDPDVFVEGEDIPKAVIGSEYAGMAGGFRVMGWRAYNVPPGRRFSARLFRTNVAHPKT